MRPFVPAWLDEQSLSPRAFRVLCHLWRRRGPEGRCNPAVASIAVVCGLHRDTVWAALAEIEKAGLLTRSRRGIRSANQYNLVVPTGGKIQPVEPQLAEKTGQRMAEKTGHHMAENFRHKGSPQKGREKGGGLESPPSLSLWISQVEAMPEFKDRSDVAEIVKIVGAERIRSAAHLARCVRAERDPQFKRGPTRQELPEPPGWWEFSRKNFPDAVFLDPASESYADGKWSLLRSDFKWFVWHQMQKNAG